MPRRQESCFLIGFFEIVGLFTPGLPANPVELAANFPAVALSVVLLAILLAWMNRLVATEERESAFRAWQNISTSSSGCTSTQLLRPSFRVRVISWISPAYTPLAFLLFFASALVLVMTLFVSSVSDAPKQTLGGSDPIELNWKETKRLCCADAGLKRLNRGQTAKILILANRVRNNQVCCR